MSIRSGQGRCCRFPLCLHSEPLRGDGACASIVRTEAVGAAFRLPSFRRKGSSAHDFATPAPIKSLAQGVLVDRLPEHRDLRVCRQFVGSSPSEARMWLRFPKWSRESCHFRPTPIDPGRNALLSQRISPRGSYELECPCHALTNGG